MGMATDVVVIDVTLQNGEPSATAEIVARRSEENRGRRIRTFWTARENPGGYLQLGDGLLYAESLPDLDRTPPFPIDLSVENRLWRSWRFDPRDPDGGEVLMALVLPSGRAADFETPPESAKRTSNGRLAVYWKFKKPRRSCELRFRLRNPTVSVEDEEKRLRRRSLRKLLNTYLQGSEILVDANRKPRGSPLPWVIALIVLFLVIYALWKGVRPEDLLRIFVPKSGG